MGPGEWEGTALWVVAPACAAKPKISQAQAHPDFPPRFYYRRIIAAFAARNVGFDLTIVHADTPTLLSNLRCNNVAAQVAIYSRLSNHPSAADADCVVVTSIAGHFCIRAFEENSPLPVLHIITEVSRAVAARGLQRLGILGTRTAMETRFYNGIPAAGVVTPAQRASFNSAIAKLLHKEGAEAIILGGTDLALAFDENTAPFPLVDCVSIHVDAIANWGSPP